MAILSTPNKIELYRLMVLREALKLEMKGIKRSARGRTSYSLLKDEGFTGNRQSVLDQVIAYVEKAKNEEV